MWTNFKDMHSGGSKKEKWLDIYIEAEETEARIIFYNRFGHNCDRVTCTCCGSDYSLSSNKSLRQLTGFARGCENDGKKYLEKQSQIYKWNEYTPLEEYIKKDSVLVIRKKEIKPEERIGMVPKQGYVWES